MATELWLVRHGQAAFASDNYDQLTDLGWQQARWLGGHLAALGLNFGRTASGTLRRQQETAQAISESLDTEPEVIPGIRRIRRRCSDAECRVSGSRSFPQPARPLSASARCSDRLGWGKGRGRRILGCVQCPGSRWRCRGCQRWRWPGAGGVLGRCDCADPVPGHGIGAGKDDRV